MAVIPEARLPINTAALIGLGGVDLERGRTELVYPSRWRERRDRDAIVRRIQDWIRERPVALRPSWSDASHAMASLTDFLTWEHTAVAGKDIHIVVCGAQNGWTSATCTYKGVPCRLLVDYTGSGNFFHSIQVYIAEASDITPGEGEIDFQTDNTSSHMAAVAFNVANGGRAAILSGMRSELGVNPVTRKAYGWDAAGLIIGIGWSLSNGIGMSISQGTNIASTGGISVNAIDANDTEEDITFTRSSGTAMTVGAYMIPPSSQSKTSGTRQAVFTGSCDFSGAAPGAVAFAGLPYGTSYVEERIGDIILGAGTWRTWQINSNRPPGSGNAVEVELCTGGSSGDPTGTCHPVPTGIVLSLSDTAQTASAQGIDFANYKYERMSLRIRNTGGDDLPADFCVRASFLRECGNANEHIFGGGIQAFGSGSEDVEVDRAALHPSPTGSWGVVGVGEKSLVGAAGQFREYVASYQLHSLHEFDWYYKRSGTLQDGSGGTVDTHATFVSDSIGQALARWRGAMPVESGDFVANTGIRRTVTGSYLRQAVTSLFVPTTAGQQVVSGYAPSAFSIGGGAYNATFNSSGSQSGTLEVSTPANEVRLLMVVPPLTNGAFRIQGMINALDVAPGSGASVQQDLRINEADAGTSITIADGATTGTVGADHALFQGYTFDTLWTPTSLPASDNQFWSIPGYLTPTDTRGVIGPHIFILFPWTRP